MRTAIALVLLAAFALPPVACAADPPETDAPKPEAKPEDGAAGPKMNHIVINREAGYIDVAGAVCLQEGMLELAVTLTGGKEHEAVFTIKARPQSVHFALLMIGAKNGKPGRWVYDENKNPVPIDPTGSKVAISVVYEKDGKKIEQPISAFIRNSQTKKALPGHVFVFAGSEVFKDPTNGKPVYMADQTGDIVTLVSFQGELLAVPTAASDANDQLIWEVNPDVTPEVGTAVTLRLRPVKQLKEGAAPDKTPNK